ICAPLGLLGVVIAAVALVVGAVSPALGSSSHGSAPTSSGLAGKQQTIRAIAVFTEFDPNIDLGAPGFSLGDEVVFSGNLLQNGKQVGRIAGSLRCPITDRHFRPVSRRNARAGLRAACRRALAMLVC